MQAFNMQVETAGCGCRVIASTPTYACQERNCNQEDICAGCTFVCAVCHKDFCEEHIVSIDKELEGGFTVYLCPSCNVSRRNEVKEWIRSI